MNAPVEQLWIGDSEPSRKFPLYTRGNAGEVFPNVVSPLTGSLFAQPSVRAQTAMFKDMGVILRRDLEDGLAALSGTFGGYLYLNLSIGRLFGARAVGMTPADVDQQMFGTSDAPPYRRQPGDRSPLASLRIMTSLVRQMRRPRFEVAAAAQRAADEWLLGLPDVAAASDEALLQLVETFPGRLEACFTALLVATAPAGGGRAIVERLLARKAGDEAAHLINRLTGGLGTIDSALLARRLWAIGRTVAADAELTAAFDLGFDTVLPRLRGSGSAAAAACVADIDAFIDEHGHRGPDEYELATPNWRMEPAMALAAIDRLRLAPAERSPEVAQTRLAADRAVALAEATAMVPAPLRGFFRHSLRSATVGAEMRERAKDAFVKELSGMRLVLHELVRRARERGGPTEARDGFLVTAEELPAYLSDPAAFAAVIDERRARRDELQARVPPFWFEGRLPDPSTWELRAPAAAIGGETLRLQGLGVCQGHAAGPARVITDANDPGELQPGDILIAPFTDPAWTPLFLAAAAVVVDVGAQQSHAAIVARELGIPAVVSVTGASRTIANGSWVTVNGDTGEVLVEPARSGASADSP
ncbi:MAG: PEP-utilizing enzyme [Ilumatobacteraceae bacterium]